MPVTRGASFEPVPLLTRYFSYVDTSGGPDACWLWTGAKSQGRGTVRGHIQAGGRGSKRYYAHRLALLVATLMQRGEDPTIEAVEAVDQEHQDLDACHDDERCTSGLCCNPRHLYWGCHRQNMTAYFRRWGARDKTTGRFLPRPDAPPPPRPKRLWTETD